MNHSKLTSDRVSQAAPPQAGAAKADIHPLLAVVLALRQFRKSPGSVLNAALTLAVGLGAAIAIYSVMAGFDAPLPSPVPDAADVMQVQIEDPANGRTAITTDDLEAWRRDSRTLETVGAFSTFDAAVSKPGHPTRLVQGAEMTAEAFAALRVTPLVGRLPSNQPDDRTSVVISHRLWRDWLEGRRDVIGEPLRLRDEQHVLVGVMPEGFRFPFHQDLWRVRAASDVGWSGLEIVARKDPSVSPKKAGDELTAILDASRPTEFGGESTARAYVYGFTEERGESGEKTMLLGLLLMVLALVMVSCSNVSNLLLERAVARASSLSVHQALGASPAQIVLQIFTEALLAALLAVAIGLGVAAGIVKFVEQTLAGHWGYYWMRVELDPSAMIFAAILGVSAAVISGTLPAIKTLRTNIAGPLKQESKSGRSRKKRWVSWALITGQVAFSCVGVIASVLMGLGLLESRKVSSDFPADSVLWATVTFDGERYESPEARRSYRSSLFSDLEAEPSVRDAALSNGLPGLFTPTRRVTRAGVPLEDHVRPVPVMSVTPDYFDVYGLRVVEGRGFLESDAADSVALVSQDFVDDVLDGESAPGRLIDIHGGLFGDRETRTVRILGVVPNVKIYRRDEDRKRSHVYLPIGDEASGHFYLSARTDGDRAAAAVAIERATRGAGPDIPVGELQSISQMLDYVRQFMETLGILAVLGGLGAIVVVTIGLYGLVSFDVGRRLPEFALRIALGAGTRRVVAGVLRRGVMLILPGLTLGLGLTYLATPLLGVFLGGTDSHDARVFLGALTVYGFIVLLAAGFPAFKAARCNPVDVLREE